MDKVKRLKLFNDWVNLNHKRWGEKSLSIPEILEEFREYWEIQSRKIK